MHTINCARSSQRLASAIHLGVIECKLLRYSLVLVVYCSIQRESETCGARDIRIVEL